MGCGRRSRATAKGRRAEQSEDDGGAPALRHEPDEEAQANGDLTAMLRGCVASSTAAPMSRCSGPTAVPDAAVSRTTMSRAARASSVSEVRTGPHRAVHRFGHPARGGPPIGRQMARSEQHRDQSADRMCADMAAGKR